MATAPDPMASNTPASGTPVPASAAKTRPSRFDLISSGTINLRRRLRTADLWFRALEMPWLWVSLFLLLGGWTLMPGIFRFMPRAVPNSIADRDFTADRDLLLLDEEATRIKQEQARGEVLQVYDLDPGVAAQREKAVVQLFADGRRLLARAPSPSTGEAESRAEALRELAASAPEPDGLHLTEEQLDLLARKKFSPDLEDRLRGILVQALRRGVVENKTQLLEYRLHGIALRNMGTGTEQVQLDLFGPLGYPQAREMIEAEVRDWSGFTSQERQVLSELLLANLPANLLPNRRETLDRREAAAASAGQVFNQIHRGQVIIRKGDVVSPAASRAVSQMRGERQVHTRIPPLAATLALLGLGALVVWFGAQRDKIADHGPKRRFGEALLLLLLSLLGARFCLFAAGVLSGGFDIAALSSERSWSYVTPFASLALLAGLLFGRNATLLLSVLFSVLASRLSGDTDSSWIVFYCLAGSLAALYALDRYQFRQRLVMARVGSMVGLVNVVLVLVLAALSSQERGIWQIGFDVLCAFAGGLLVAAVGSFAVPILESMLNITTDIKLVELSNTNLPLLRRLAFEAPGTFQHSLMVANLAKEGCEAIGADPVLAYAGGLYHDVGKVLRPDYFVENQRPGHNRHDKLLPSMSALIIVNHVKDGVELAVEHNLPRVIRDAVRQHHGTRLMSFFYKRAQELSDPEAGEVTEDMYRYPGPKPQNKVMGVLMLADAVEAASRTLTEPTPLKIRGMIRQILDSCLNDGQLDHTDLTLSDLHNVSEAFLRVLANIFHQRVDYPGFDFNAGTKREKRPLADAVRAS